MWGGAAFLLRTRFRCVSATAHVLKSKLAITIIGALPSSRRNNQRHKKVKTLVNGIQKRGTWSNFHSIELQLDLLGVLIWHSAVHDDTVMQILGVNTRHNASCKFTSMAHILLTSNDKHCCGG